MFDIALDYDVIDSRPLRKKLHKPEFERQEKPILPVADARRLLKGLSYGERLFIAVLSVLTIRVNEGAALRWLNLDFETGILSLTHGAWKRRLKPTLTESFYDHAENVVDAQTTGLLLNWLVGENHELLQQSDTVN